MSPFGPMVGRDIRFLARRDARLKVIAVDQNVEEGGVKAYRAFPETGLRKTLHLYGKSTGARAEVAQRTVDCAPAIPDGVNACEVTFDGKYRYIEDFELFLRTDFSTPFPLPSREKTSVSPRLIDILGSWMTSIQCPDLPTSGRQIDGFIGWPSNASSQRWGRRYIQDRLPRGIIPVSYLAAYRHLFRISPSAASTSESMSALPSSTTSALGATSSC